MAGSTIAAGIGAAASIGGGIMGLFGGGGDAAVEAAQIQAAAARYAADLQMKQYEESVKRLQPWTGAGTAAVNEYAGLLNLPGYPTTDRTDYLRSTPGYEFQLAQGVNALDRSAASKGMLLSGPQTKAVTKYGQGLADTTYNALMDRIYNLSNQGQSSAALVGNQGMLAGQYAGNALMSGANAQAQGLYNAYNARQSAYGNITGGVAMAANAIGKAAPAISDWWSGGSGGYDTSLWTPAEANYYQMTDQYR